MKATIQISIFQKQNQAANTMLRLFWSRFVSFHIFLHLCTEIVVHDSNITKDGVIGKASIPFRPDIEPHKEVTKKVPIRKVTIAFVH
jgi:hypothetical protein